MGLLAIPSLLILFTVIVVSIVRRGGISIMGPAILKNKIKSKIRANRLFTRDLLLFIAILAPCQVLESCSAFKPGTNTPEYATDLVCGMRVDKADAYVWKYKEVKYYFCSYNCKETFKMNPQQVLDKCAEKK